MSAIVVLLLGDDISTDTIYPGRFMATGLPSETPKYAFADDVALNKRLVDGEIPKGSIIVAGKNFGCGSSREQAASTLKGYELTIVAKAYARIFRRNAVNVGLNIIICPEIEAEDSDELMIQKDKVINITTRGLEFDIMPLSEIEQAIIDAGGLIPYTKKLFLESRGKQK